MFAVSVSQSITKWQQHRAYHEMSTETLRMHTSSVNHPTPPHTTYKHTSGSRSSSLTASTAHTSAVESLCTNAKPLLTKYFSTSLSSSLCTLTTPGRSWATVGTCPGMTPKSPVTAGINTRSTCERQVCACDAYTHTRRAAHLHVIANHPRHTSLFLK